MQSFKKSTPYKEYQDKELWNIMIKLFYEKMELFKWKQLRE